MFRYGHRWWWTRCDFSFLGVFKHVLIKKSPIWHHNESLPYNSTDILLFLNLIRADNYMGSSDFLGREMKHRLSDWFEKIYFSVCWKTQPGAMNLWPLKPVCSSSSSPSPPPVPSWVNASARCLIDGCNGAVYGHSSLPVYPCYSDLVREQPASMAHKPEIGGERRDNR